MAAGALDNPAVGSKGIGMGNSFTAIADDASAVYYNPAGLAFNKKVLSLDNLLLSPYAEWKKEFPAGNVQNPFWQDPDIRQPRHAQKMDSEYRIIQKASQGLQPIFQGLNLSGQRLHIMCGLNASNG